MTNSTRKQLIQETADEVQKLLTQNPAARDRFREQLKVCNGTWLKYWSAFCNELPSREERPDKSERDAYEYDRSLKGWFPKDEAQLPPDPSKWEPDDKYPCYYATLAVVYDSEKGEDAPFRLCEGILDGIAFRLIKHGIYEAWLDEKVKARLGDALAWVEADLSGDEAVNGQSADTQSGEATGQPDGTKETKGRSAGKKNLRPLPKRARLIYEMLNGLQPLETKTTSEIALSLQNEHEMIVDESTIRRDLKLLKPHGLKSAGKKRGYYIKKDSC